MAKHTKQQTVPSIGTGHTEPLEALLSMRDVMRLLGVSRRTVYTLMRDEGLPCFYVRGQVRCTPASLRRWIAGCKQVA